MMGGSNSGFNKTMEEWGTATGIGATTDLDTLNTSFQDVIGSQLDPGGLIFTAENETIADLQSTIDVGNIGSSNVVAERQAEEDAAVLAEQEAAADAKMQAELDAEEKRIAEAQAAENAITAERQQRQQSSQLLSGSQGVRLLQGNN